MTLKMTHSIVKENSRTLIFQVVCCVHIAVKESRWIFYQITAFFLVLVHVLYSPKRPLLKEFGPIFALINSPCNLTEVKGVAQDATASSFGLLHQNSSSRQEIAIMTTTEYKFTNYPQRELCHTNNKEMTFKLTETCKKTKGRDELISHT